MNEGIKFRSLGGTRVIGGNFFQLKGTSLPLYLDAGMPLFTGGGDDAKAVDLDLFRLARDPQAGCQALRAQGHLPEGTGLFLDEEPQAVAAVVITHAHMDHWGLLPFMHPSVPVISSAVTRRLISCQLAWRGQSLAQHTG